MASPARILVAGSLNMDFVAVVPHLPAPGETILGSDFKMLPGGKGANQANAAGRLGGRVSMAGAVGTDVFGNQLRFSLQASKVDCSLLTSKSNVSTGVALIGVEHGGQNTIIVASGANALFDESDAEALRPSLREAGFLLLQLESPLATIERLATLAVKLKTRVILDPAPAQPLPASLLRNVDILTPNESEALMLLGETPRRISRDEAPLLADRLMDLGVKHVVLKLGDQGCFYAGEFLPAFPVQAVDATAAGDTFNGALAVALAEGQPMPFALRFANAAAAISVTRLGAQASQPQRTEVDALLASSGI